MAARGLSDTNKLLLKPFSLIGLGCMSRLYHGKTTHKEVEVPPPPAEEEWRKEEGAACWMPHPRTGIYFPRGQERVMEDIPSGAASFDCTFWFRSIDGVDDQVPPKHDFMQK